MLEDVEIVPYIKEFLIAAEASLMLGDHRVGNDYADLIFVNLDASVAMREFGSARKSV
jgi:hypothetical protein